jgi:hypothetical protein
VSKAIHLGIGKVVEDLVIVMPDGCELRGQVTPLGGFLTAEAMLGTMLQLSDAEGKVCTVQPDGAGRFRVVGLKNGTYLLTLLSAPQGYALAPCNCVVDGVTDVQIGLVPASTISGRVLNQMGQGVQAKVWLRGKGNYGVVPLHSTDEAGQFRLDVAPGFEGVVGAYFNGAVVRTSDPVSVRAGDSDVLVRLQGY